MKLCEIIKIARFGYPDIGRDALQELAKSYRAGATDVEQLKAAAEALEVVGDRMELAVKLFILEINSRLAELTAVVNKVNAQRKGRV